MSAHMTLSQKKAARNENCMTKPKKKNVLIYCLANILIKVELRCLNHVYKHS